MCTGRLLRFIREYFVSSTNSKLATLSLPWLDPIKTFRRQLYVQESPASATMTQFRYNVAPIGNKYPRVGRFSTQHVCPLCPCQIRNSGSHLALFCPAIEKVRKERTSISSFRNSCIFKGFSEDYTFNLFINGKDWNENPVSSEDYLERGRELEVLTASWLDMW